MSTVMQDSIQKVIVIKAPIERVYRAVADPKEVTAWFPDSVEGNMNAGDHPVFSFGEDHVNRVYIEAAQPHSYFAFRWIPASRSFLGDVLAEANTLVEFRFTSVDGGTQVNLTESGFSMLPADVREQKFQDNNGGWDFMIGRLEQLFQEK